MYGLEHIFENAELKSLETYKECGMYYLKGVWEYSNDIGRYELTMPKIDLGIFAKNSSLSITLNSRNTSYGVLNNFIVYERPFIYCDDRGIKFNIKELERFEKEMTIEEIEKELGHKVKIVSK